MNSCGSRPTSIRFRPTNTPMPWSTWTTRSPTFRSRKSERNVAGRRAPALVDLPLFLEDVGLGPELERRLRAAGSRATGARCRRAPRPCARPRRARSAPRRPRSRRAARSSRSARPAELRDEDDGVAALARRGGSRRPSRERGRRTRAPADMAMWRDGCAVVAADLERLERGRAVEPAASTSSHSTTSADPAARAGAPFATASS